MKIRVKLNKSDGQLAKYYLKSEHNLLLLRY